MRRLNGLFWFFVLKTTYVMYDHYDMYQFVASYIKWNYNFCLPPSWMWAYTLGEIKERDFEVAAQPGRDNISVCTCTGYCLGETGRNACLCRSAQQFCTSSCHWTRGTASLWMNTRCVAGRFFRKWRGIKVYLFFPCGKIFIQLQICTLFHKLSMFFHCCEDNIPSCEAHKQFGVEPAQYGLEINFKAHHGLKFSRYFLLRVYFAGSHFLQIDGNLQN